jgi:hypothetical protein
VRSSGGTGHGSRRPPHQRRLGVLVFAIPSQHTVYSSCNTPNVVEESQCLSSYRKYTPVDRDHNCSTPPLSGSKSTAVPNRIFLPRAEPQAIGVSVPACAAVQGEATLVRQNSPCATDDTGISVPSSILITVLLKAQAPPRRLLPKEISMPQTHLEGSSSTSRPTSHQGSVDMTALI